MTKPAGCSCPCVDPSAAAFKMDVSTGADFSSSCSNGSQSNSSRSLVVFTQKLDGEGTVLQSFTHSNLTVRAISVMVALESGADLRILLAV